MTLSKPALAVCLGVLSTACYPQDSEAQTAEEKPDRQSVYDRRAMRKYSENETTRGVGWFINLEANSPYPGEDLCEAAMRRLAETENSAPSKCRFNQSRGTITDITAYLRGVPYQYTINNIQENMENIAMRNAAAWLDKD